MVRLITFLSLSLSQVQECIRRLVSVIRRSSTGGSPVDSEQLEHIQKVVRVLSLSEEQVSSMRFEDRAQVLKIRKKQRPVEDRLISASHKHEPQAAATSHEPQATSHEARASQACLALTLTLTLSLNSHPNPKTNPNQVLKIRSNALQKMRLANNVRLSANSSDGGSSTCSSPTLGPSSPLSASPPGPSSYGSSPLSYGAWSAPTAIPMQVPMSMSTGSEAARVTISASSLPDHLSMPPPAFYVRRERVSET